MDFTQLLTFQVGDFEIVVSNDVTQTANSADKNYSYDKEYLFGEHVSSKHGVTTSFFGKKVSSCILKGSGGLSTVHENSALIYGNSCVVAVGNHLCSLALPSLELEWQTQVDEATCFGVYRRPDHNSFISHGELTITCVSSNGKIIWQTGGKEIFTSDFLVTANYIEAVDFNGERYKIDIETGFSEIINR